MSYYVYILECVNKALYAGITTDLKRRLAEHKTGKGGHYTSYNPGKKIRYAEKQPTRSAALKREAEIKKWPRARKLALIRQSDSVKKILAMTRQRPGYYTIEKRWCA